VIAAAVTVAPLLSERLAGKQAPSQLQELLGGRPVEVLLVAILDATDPAPVEERIREYLERVRGVGLEITGDDLRSAGVAESPAIGSALRRTLALKLDGEVSGRDAELEAALRLVSEGAAADD
jgi:hypothetical protein